MLSSVFKNDSSHTVHGLQSPAISLLSFTLFSCRLTCCRPLFTRSASLPITCSVDVCHVSSFSFFRESAISCAWPCLTPSSSPCRTTAGGWTMCSNCGSSRPASFQPRSATTANFVWTTCCTHAPPASPAPTPSSGASTSNSTTCQPSATYAFIYTRRRTRRDAR